MFYVCDYEHSCTGFIKDKSLGHTLVSNIMFIVKHTYYFHWQWSWAYGHVRTTYIKEGYRSLGGTLHLTIRLWFHSRSFSLVTFRQSIWLTKVLLSQKPKERSPHWNGHRLFRHEFQKREDLEQTSVTTTTKNFLMTKVSGPSVVGKKTPCVKEKTICKLDQLQIRMFETTATLRNVT